ncbi:MAG: DNA-binding protein [Parcubacteria group bacterium 20-58-5]|nr:MAG: DNA-binding protein [Parcubacteria group bacterium 20-58-5]HQU08168.1 helix-turn-helix domain-containing protein [Candidatus Paceibacterota bacterium]
MAKGTEFYTAKEVAEILKVNIMTIYRYIKAGRLQAHKIGKDFRIEKSELERFLKKTSTK